MTASFKGVDKVKKVGLQTLRRQYELIQMEASETITAYILRVLALTKQMKIYGEEYNEQAKVEKILRSLTSRFEHIVVAIEEAHDLSEMSVDELSGALQAHEQSMNEKQADKPIEQALQAQVSIKGEQRRETSKKHGSSRGRGRGQSSHFSNNRSRGGHNNNYGTSDNQNHDQEKSDSNHQQYARRRGHGRGRGRYDRSNVECYSCHKRGHYSNECRSKKSSANFSVCLYEGEVGVKYIKGEKKNYQL